MPWTSQQRARVRQGLWLAFAATALVLWPVGSHLLGLWMFWPLQGVPAFFLGLFVLVLVGALVRLVAGMFRQGWRWGFGRQAIRLVLGAAALLISTVVLFYSVELWRGKRAWARVVEEARRQGQSLDPKSLIPSPVPPGQDFAAAPLFAPLERTAAVTRDASGNRIKPDLGPLTNVLRWCYRFYDGRLGLPLAPWLEGRSTDLPQALELCLKLQGTNQPVVPTNRSAAAAGLLEVLEPFEGMIGQLRAHSTKPQCRLPFDYAFPFFAERYSEQVLVSFMRVLRLRASAELALECNEAAFQDVQLTVRLAEYLRQQPGIYSLSMRAYAVADGLQPLWEGLEAGRWTAPQLEALQRQLLQFDPQADYLKTIRFAAFAEAGFVEGMIPTTSPERGTWPGFQADAQLSIRWARRFYPRGWSLQDQAAIYDQWLRQTAAGPARTGLVPGAGNDRDSLLALLRASSDPFFPVFLFPRLLELQQDTQEHLGFAQAAASLGGVACALERHRLAAGAYPESLAGLVPRFLERLPLDVMDGHSLRYRRGAPGGFVLYSVGLNGKDDGGQPCPRRRSWKGEIREQLNLGHNDWVWRRSAGE